MAQGFKPFPKAWAFLTQKFGRRVLRLLGTRQRRPP